MEKVLTLSRVSKFRFQHGRTHDNLIYSLTPDLRNAIQVPLTHFFTPEEANRVLPDVRTLVSQVVELKRKIDSSGERSRSEDMSKLTLLISKIEERGAELKDADMGLIDFPAVRFSEPVYLCWKLGEEEVLFWHGSEGFRGRKPLKPEAAKIV